MVRKFVRGGIFDFFSTNLKEGANDFEFKANLTHLAHKYVSSYQPSKQVLRKHAILKKLRNNPDIVITKPDKGNGVVIMDAVDYNKRMMEMISDPTKFEKRNRYCGVNAKDITIYREEQLQRYLYSLKKKGLLDKNIYDKVYPSGSLPARIYGQPKMHKLNVNNNLSKQVPPFRIIVSSIGAYNYNIAKYLTNILSPHITTQHCAQDSFSFVEDLKQVSLQNKFLVSYDVVSLFTNIPLDETIDLAVDIIKSNDPSVKMSRVQLRKLFLFATSQTHFVYKGQYYDQVDGVAMGSPLGPVLANLFMGVHEADWLRSYPGQCPLFYRRYVDDILCVFDSANQATSFLEYLNNRHPNIKFTCETETEGVMAFLDVLISRDLDGNPVTTTYRKPTNTGLLTNYSSFTSYSYKIGLIKTLTDRAHKINSDAMKLVNDLKFISKVLQRNAFPSFLIRKIMSGYPYNKVIDPPVEPGGETSESPESRYFKLPYIGDYSNSLKVKLKQFVTQYCDNIDARFIFTTHKVGQYFSNKDPVPSDLQSHKVYKFTCGCCKASYIGETARHVSTRVMEHLESDKKSAIYQHLHAGTRQSRLCRRNSNADSFIILDHAETKHQLRIKEGLYIKRDSPELNKQVNCYVPSISL